MCVSVGVGVVSGGAVARPPSPIHDAYAMAQLVLPHPTTTHHPLLLYNCCLAAIPRRAPLPLPASGMHATLHARGPLESARAVPSYMAPYMLC